MTLGQYDPELIFGFTSQQMAMLASKLVSDRILDILTSIYINISTFNSVRPSVVGIINVCPVILPITVVVSQKFVGIC